LTHELKGFRCGNPVYGTDKKVSHLLHMDDLKLIGRSEEQVRNEIRMKNHQQRHKNGVWTRFSLKRSRFQGKQHTQETVRNGIYVFGLRREP
jgi:hypothetical protein